MSFNRLSQTKLSKQTGSVTDRCVTCFFSPLPCTLWIEFIVSLSMSCQGVVRKELCYFPLLKKHHFNLRKSTTPKRVTAKNVTLGLGLGNSLKVALINWVAIQLQDLQTGWSDIEKIDDDVFRSTSTF